jgi:disulfide bond formation protein DsbB
MPRLTNLQIVILIFVITAGTISGAWFFELSGYTPCDLCRKERIPYYAALALAVLALPAAIKNQRTLIRSNFLGLGLLFIISMFFGIYHSGVEWGFWPGPSDCSGSLNQPASVTDFFNELKSVKVVRCDTPALKIFSLSLAAWNALISAFLAAVSLYAATRKKV